MKGRSSLFLAGLCLAGLVLSSCGRQRLNLVFISMDTTRADHLGVYGYEEARTPNIDALAANGFLFRRHMTPVPLTLPSHTSMFTGHYPPTHTVRDNGTFYVPEGEVTLAETLRDAGYDTAAFVASFPLDAKFNLNQGFAVYDDHYPRKSETGSNPDRPAMSIYFDERPARDVVDAALAYHRGREPGPFFTFLHFFDAHQPQKPPPPFDVEFRRKPYDGEIAYVDQQIGRFFDYLKASGNWDNTLIVLTGDHGEGLGEHGELTHSILLHQPTLHVPLILSGPPVAVGETNAWTMSTQLYATILDLLAIAKPDLEKPISASLKPLLDNGGVRPEGSERFTAYFETIAPRTTQGWSQLTAWMKGDWRLVHGPKPELYNLDLDPEEMENRLGVNPEIESTLFAELAEFLAANESKSVGSSIEMSDEETVQRLAALGYLSVNSGELTELDDMLAVDGLVNPRDRVVDVSLFSRSKAAMAAGRWNLARELNLELIQRSPQAGLAYKSLAVLYGQIQDWDQCFANLDKAIELLPEDVSTLQLRGQLLIQTGHLEEGIEILLHAGKPEDSVNNSIFLARAYQSLGQKAPARHWFEQALRLDPNGPWPRLMLANQLAMDGDYDGAEHHYRQLIRTQPYFGLAYYNYGKLMFDRGDPQAAHSLWQRSRQLSPNHQPTLEALRILAAGENTPAGDAGNSATGPTTTNPAATNLTTTNPTAP